MASHGTLNSKIHYVKEQVRIFERFEVLVCFFVWKVWKIWKIWSVVLVFLFEKYEKISKFEVLIGAQIVGTSAVVDLCVKRTMYTSTYRCQNDHWRQISPSKKWQKKCRKCKKNAVFRENCGVFAKVRTQEFRKSVWSWSEIFIRCKKKIMEVVWNTEALVQCGGAPGTLRILRVFARFQLNILRFFYAKSRELRVSKVCGNKFKFSPL